MESSFTLLRVVRAAKKLGFGYGLVGIQPTDFEPWEGRGLLRDRHQPEPVLGPREKRGPVGRCDEMDDATSDMGDRWRYAQCSEPLAGDD
jgi:hypothetical protein